MINITKINVTHEQIITACKDDSIEYYNSISENYIFFNRVYIYLQHRYKIPTIQNLVKRHIVFISIVVAFIRNVTLVEITSFSTSRYKLYNSYFDTLSNLITIVDGDIDMTEFKKNFYAILNDLCKQDLLKKIEKRVQHKTEIFYEFDFLQKMVYQGFKFSFSEYITFKKNNIPYIASISIFSIKRLIKQNNRSNKLSDIDINGLKQLNKTPIYLDQNLVAIAAELFKQESQESIRDIQTNIANLLNKYKLNLTQNKRELSNIECEIDSLELGTDQDVLRFHKKNFKEKLSITNTIREEQKKYNREINLQLDKLNFLKFLEVAKIIGDRKFYIPHHCDFRARIYSSSKLSPIIYKYIRCVITYGTYTEDEISLMESDMLKTKAYKILSKYLHKLERIKMAKSRPIKGITLLFLLIELSKKDKISMLDKYTFSVHIEAFIDRGIEIYLNNTTKKNSFEDALEYQKILYHIKNIIRGDIYNNFIIAKDSTASVLQHLFKWLEANSRLAIKICNIDGLDS